MTLRTRLLGNPRISMVLAVVGAMLPKPPRSFFIVGCGHTGTSLLFRMLSTHSMLFARQMETGAFLGPAGRPSWYKLDALLIAFALSGRPILLEKTPRHIRRLSLIRDTLSSPAFILAVRDGRDVVASLAARYGDFEEAMSRWLADTSLVLSERNSSDCIVWRYEDLVADAESRLRALCAWMEIPFQTAMLNFHEDRRPYSRRGNAHLVMRDVQVHKPIFDGRGRWKSLTEDQLARFSSGPAAELQRAFGYPERS